MATATMTPQPSPPRISAKNRKRINIVLLTTLTAVILAIFLMPLAYGVMTSLKTEAQISSIGAPWYPASPVVYEYEGREYDVYEVPVDGNTYEWALVNKGVKPASLSIPLIPVPG